MEVENIPFMLLNVKAEHGLVCISPHILVLNIIRKNTGWKFVSTKSICPLVGEITTD